MFKYSEIAEGFFQHVVAPVLGGVHPREIRPEPGSYVDEHLAGSYSDLLYSCRLGETAALVYLLVEHQRTVERMMALRMTHYCISAIEDWMKAHPGQNLVPPAVPIVLYQGERPWTAATGLKDLYGLSAELDEAIGSHIPSARFILIDLKKLDLESLRGGLLPRLALSLMKAVIEYRQVEWLEAHGEDLSILLQRADGRTILRLMFNYIAATRKPGKGASTMKELAFKGV